MVFTLKLSCSAICPVATPWPNANDPAPATVTLTITPVNDLPVADPDSGTVSEGETVTLSVVTNDTDPEGSLNPASLALVQAPAHGLAQPQPDGSVIYTHDGSETTSDSFTYTVTVAGALMLPSVSATV